MARKRDPNKYEMRICNHPDCQNQFEIYKKSPKQYCSRKCSTSAPDEILKRNISTKKTIDKKYNGKHPMSFSDVQNKHKNTMLLNHGVEHALQNKNILKSMKNSIINKYGGWDKIYKKGAQTKLKLYGNPTGNPINRRIKIYEKILLWDHITPLFNKQDIINNGVVNIKYKFKCNICNIEFSRSINNGYIPKCRACALQKSTFRSKGEIEVETFISTITTENILINVRNIIPNREIDIYLPKHKFAIEYNGLLWHSEIFGKKDKNYHLYKTRQCIQQGIQLIHITDYQWKFKCDIIKSIILAKLNKTNKIFARKCIIKELNRNIKKEFLNNTHLYGNCNSKINLGLYYNNELIFIMTFGKPRYDNIYEWELLRFSSKLNTTIIGGFSKLLSYFIKIYNPKNILVYCPRNISCGNVFFKNNFKLINTTNPGYQYLNLDYLNPFPREKFQKHKLPNILERFDYNLSEWENMKLNKYDRIWDCGNYKFQLII